MVHVQALTVSSSITRSKLVNLNLHFFFNIYHEVSHTCLSDYLEIKKNHINKNTVIQGAFPALMFYLILKV